METLKVFTSTIYVNGIPMDDLRYFPMIHEETERLIFKYEYMPKDYLKFILENKQYKKIVI